MTLEEAMPTILETLSRFLNREITVEDLSGGYESLGADSMDMVALAFELEQMTGRVFEPEMLLQKETIHDALVSFFE